MFHAHRLGIEGLLVRASLLAESQCCVVEQDTLSAAKYWFNPGRPISTWLKNCWLKNETKQKYCTKCSTKWRLRSNESWHEISNNVVCATSKASDQPAHTHSLIRAFASCLIILWVLSYWPNIIWSFWALKEATKACMSLHLSKYHIVGNHMSRLKY